MVTKKRIAVPANAVHPGEMLREEFMSPLGLTAYRLAKDLKLPPPRVNDIVREKRGISADTALRLARYFGNSPEFWMNVQTRYDLLIARKQLDCKDKAAKSRSNRLINDGNGLRLLALPERQ